MEGPWPAARRGRLLTRDGSPYESGNVWADDLLSRPAARITFEVHPAKGMVLLGNADSDGKIGQAGDVQARGAARAMLNELDRLYPPPDWWLAADPGAGHTAEGLALMRSRRKPGRQWVHTSDCTNRLVWACSCEFPEPRLDDGD